MQGKDNYEPKKCESCGREFGCGANADGCWCSALALDSHSISDLKRKFVGCLCPDCLEAVARHTENG